VFKDKVATPEWQAKIKEIVPSYGTKLNDSAAATQKEWNYTAEVLQLEKPPVIDQSVRRQRSSAAAVESKPATTWRCSLPLAGKPGNTNHERAPGGLVVFLCLQLGPLWTSPASRPHPDRIVRRCIPCGSWVPAMGQPRNAGVASNHRLGLAQRCPRMLPSSPGSAPQAHRCAANSCAWSPHCG
jgi:hypothetical protein